MKPIVEVKDSMEFTGYVKEIIAKENANNQMVRSFWKEIFQRNLYNNLYDNSDELNVVGVRYDYDMTNGNFKYMIGIRNRGFEIEGTSTLFLGKQNYACFETSGPMPDAIENLIMDVHNDWLPNSNYHHAGKAEIEIYSDGDVKDEKYNSFFWITIIPK